LGNATNAVSMHFGVKNTNSTKMNLYVVYYLDGSNAYDIFCHLEFVIEIEKYN